MSAVLSGAEWEEIYARLYPGFRILDPDGWDRRPDKWKDSWGAGMFQDEFEMRVAASTCCLPVVMIKTMRLRAVSAE